MFSKNIKLKSSVEKSSTLINGRRGLCGVDSGLEAWIISPSVDNSQDVKKLSWVWFEQLRFGVPFSSGTFDLDTKSQLVLIIINYQLDVSHKEVWFCSNIEHFKYINIQGGFKTKKKWGLPILPITCLIIFLKTSNTHLHTRSLALNHRNLCV